MGGFRGGWEVCRELVADIHMHSIKRLELALRVQRWMGNPV